MKTTDFNWGDETINSRDIINKYDDLQEEYDSLVEALEEANDALKEYNEENPDGEDPAEADELVENIKDAQEALNDFNSSFDKDELDTLREIVKQGEDSSDWGDEALIHEDNFTDYIKNLIEDCYEMPEEFESGHWPYNHITLDFEGAAEEAKVDYIEIDADGHTYYIRSV